MTLATQSNQRVDFANTLRGIAALMVMFGHHSVIFWQYRDVAAGISNGTPLPAEVVTPDYLLALNHLNPFSFGVFGVAIFFLISGFVIPFSITNINWRGFLIGRFFRIYPTYIIGLSISLTLITLSGLYYGKGYPYSLAVTMANYFPGARDVIWVPGIDGVIWTLDVEMKFYLVCAAGYALIKAGKPTAFLIPLLLAIPAIIIAPQVLAPSNWQGQLYTFCASIQYINFMFIGVAFHYLYKGLLRPQVFMTIVVALFLVTAAIMWRAVIVPFNLMWTYGLALLVFSTAFSFPYLLKSRPVTDFLADISFPLYVVHSVLGYTVLRVVAEMGVPGWLCMVIAAVASIAVATALHYLIEMPSHRIGHKLASKTAAGQATQSGYAPNGSASSAERA
jgi:peptidoglycan/LPS O-acetylase OafA/YrhL